MTRKDFVAMAACVATERAKAKEPGWESLEHARTWAAACDTIALNMAAHMAQDNPRFDRDRFLTACGVL